MSDSAGQTNAFKNIIYVNYETKFAGLIYIRCDRWSQTKPPDYKIIWFYQLS